ncbi:hypothetical protein LR48_Vigan06g113300 [Vigna angularis]|uniref:J domain-containing protein n=1 Tax=Phaseolus angularis TaxID=3914 RepID=A0A0L9UTB2_PHAAN|nr:hypothetical protein LR48_Vigan06g113300 [Vigna angularis]
MTGKGVSREHFQPKTCSGKREDFRKIVFIDVDSDQVDEVVIIDYPEFMSKSHGSGAPSRDRVCTPQSVISIDDDDDEESDDAEIPGVVAGGVGELDSDASSTKMSSPDSSAVRNSIDIDVDENGVREKESEFDGVKIPKAGPGEGTSRNRYGLDGSESESSDSDCSDCELMDREQWEKISVKRKRTGFNDQPCYDEHASSSGLHFNNTVCTDIDEKNRNRESAGGATHFCPTNGENVEKNRSSFPSDWETFKSSLFEFTETEMQSLHHSCEIEHGRSTRSKDFSPGIQNESNDFCSDVTGVSRFNKEFSGEECGLSNLNQEEAHKNRVTNPEPTLKSKADSLFDTNSKCASTDERHVNCDGPALNDHHCGLTGTTSNERDIINEREKLKETDEYKQAMEEEWASRQLQLQIQAEEAQMLRKRRKAEKRELDMQRRQKERIEEDEEFMNLKEQLRVEIRKGLNHLEMRCHDMTSLLRGLGIHVGESFTPLPNEAIVGLVLPSSSLVLVNPCVLPPSPPPIPHGHLHVFQFPFDCNHSSLHDVLHSSRSVSDRIVTLQLIGSEFSLLPISPLELSPSSTVWPDLSLPSTVRSGLSSLSTVRLGLPPSTVQAAYKRALFTFHPDRASKTDVRAQVEAEEKFKLISRLKDKFLLTSCH